MTAEALVGGSLFHSDVVSCPYLAAKGKFINDNGLAGFAIWEITGDWNNTLVTAISDAMGIVPVCT